MTNILDDYLDELKLQLRALPLSQQRQVLDDVRTHLEAAVKRLTREDKALSMDEAALQATHSFGEPATLAVGYGGGGVQVRRSTGEVVLHVATLAGRGVARTVGKTFKWTGISLAFLLTLGTLAFLVLAVAYQPTIDKGLDVALRYEPRTLAYRQESYQANTGTFTDSFVVTADMRNVELLIQIAPGPQPSGCANIVVKDSGGASVYDNTGACSADDFRASPTVPGTYTVTYRLVSYTGTVQLQAKAIEVHGSG